MALPKKVDFAYELEFLYLLFTCSWFFSKWTFIFYMELIMKAMKREVKKRLGKDATL